MIGCSMPNNSVMADFTNSSSLLALGSVDDFKQTGSTHAATHAHRDNGVFRFATAALDQGVAGQARAGHAVGMTDRDRAAIDVELFRIDAKLVAAIDHLHRERLVQFPEIDIVDRESVPLEKPGH